MELRPGDARIFDQEWAKCEEAYRSIGATEADIVAHKRTALAFFKAGIRFTRPLPRPVERQDGTL
jgi:uncharacterized membrane protein YidH (DUF202 family)